MSGEMDYIATGKCPDDPVVKDTRPKQEYVNMKTEEEKKRTKKAGAKLFHKTLLFRKRTFDYSYYCLNLSILFYF